MPTFTYKALDHTGDQYTGEVDAADRFAVYAHVRKENGTVVSVKEKGGALGGFSLKRVNRMLGRVKESEKIMFARNLSAMLDAGLALSRALSVLERQSKNEKLRTVLSAVNQDIAQGGDFHSALEKQSGIFTPLMVSMVRAGEESGKLAESLAVVGDQMEQVYQLKKKIRGALIYPAIVVVALIIVGILMMMFIVPTLSATFDELGAELPATTQTIIGISDFMVAHTLLTLLIIVGAIAGFISALRTKRGSRAFEWFVLHVPIIRGIAKEASAARTGRTLSSLLSSGVQVMDALEITEEVVQNSYYREVLDAARERVQTGSPISAVFAEREELYPPLVGELMAVGEETGRLPDMLARIAEFYEGEVEQKTKNMSTIIEPFLMLIVGAVVGFFAISMITPIYSITQSI